MWMGPSGSTQWEQKQLLCCTQRLFSSIILCRALGYVTSRFSRLPSGLIWSRMLLWAWTSLSWGILVGLEQREASSQNNPGSPFWSFPIFCAEQSRSPPTQRVRCCSLGENTTQTENEDIRPPGSQRLTDSSEQAVLDPNFSWLIFMHLVI